MKNFSYVITNRILITGINGFFWILIASLMLPEQYGELSYIIAIAGVASLIAKFGFQYSVVISNSNNENFLSRNFNGFVFLSSTITALILIPINEYAALASIGFSFFAMNQHNLLGLRKYKQFMINGLIRSILLLTIPLSLYFILGIPGIIIGLVIGDLLCSIQYFKSISINKKILEILKINFKQHVNNFAIDLSITLPRVLDKLIIVPLYGFLFTGIYQFNFQILLALETLPVALHSYLLPEESRKNSNQKIVYLMIFLTIVITIVSILISPFFVQNLFPEYYDGITSLQIILISIIPMTISSVYSARLQAKKSSVMGFAVIVRIGTLLGLIVILGDSYGLIGLSLSVLISTILYTIFLFFLYQRFNLKHA